MDNSNIINILDLGSTKLRFAVFDNQLNEKFSESKNVVLNDDYSDHFEQINYIIKKAEKKISSHIQDIVLTLDCKDLFIVDLSLRKDTDRRLWKSSFFLQMS